MFEDSIIKNRMLKALFIAAGIIYALIMIKLLFFRGPIYFWDSYNYNLIPFKTIRRYIIYKDHFNLDTWVKNLFGNIIMFIPLGVFIPVFKKKLLKPALFFISIVAVLSGMELVQMLTRVGSFDVDDIILNTLGAMIGLGATTAFKRIYNRF